jgi:small subunit ribosomal protein S20
LTLAALPSISRLQERAQPARSIHFNQQCRPAAERVTRREGPTGIPTRSAMANTKSAKKMVRKIAKRTEVNKARRSRMRTFLRKVEEAIAAGDQTAATQALRNAEPEIMRAAQKGIVHKNMASRKVSRLAARVRALAA